MCEILLDNTELDETSQLKLSYERVVDSFIPSTVPKVTTDEPLGQQKHRDEYELRKAYRQVYEGKKFKP